MAKRAFTLSVLPVLLTVSVTGPATAAPGQPGLAVPGEGQPGLTQSPPPAAAPPAPSLADYIPEPPSPPARPRPQQQEPDRSTLVQPPVAQDPDEEPTRQPAPAAVDPHVLRLGTTTVQLPNFVDARTRDKAQAYADYAEWQIAAGYDGLGFSREESDRRAASTVAGGATGAFVGTVGTPSIAAVVGCVPGGIIGGIVGAVAAGIPTAGVGAGIGGTVGAVAGCTVGAMVAVVPTVLAGAALGAVVGGTVGGTLGAGTDVQPPAEPLPPLVEVSAPQAAASPEQAIVQQVADTVEAVSPQGAAVENSLRSAVSTMPTLDPAAAGPLADPITDFVDAMRAGLGV